MEGGVAGVGRQGEGGEAGVERGGEEGGREALPAPQAGGRQGGGQEGGGRTVGLRVRGGSRARVVEGGLQVALTRVLQAGGSGREQGQAKEQQVREKMCWLLERMVLHQNFS